MLWLFSVQVRSGLVVVFRGRTGPERPNCICIRPAGGGFRLMGRGTDVLLPPTRLASGTGDLVVAKRRGSQPNAPYKVGGHGDPEEGQGQ
jgi:hypothetical protein